MALSAQTPRPKQETMADFLAIPAPERWHEFVDGRIIERAMPVSDHGHVQRKLGALLDGYDGPEGEEGPGGWWLVVDAEVDFPRLGRRLRPDLTGWRRQALPSPPAPVETQCPDWVCEVISERTQAQDRGKKRRVYRREGVGHYWLVDPRIHLLEVYRLEGGRYTLVDTWEGDARVRAEPFDSLPLELDALWRL
jgi:Uma2 family endonuclease